MGALDLAAEVGGVAGLLALRLPNEVGNFNVVAVRGHVREGTGALFLDEGEEVLGVARVDVIHVFVLLATHHQLDQAFVFGRKIFVDYVEKFVPVVVAFVFLF